MDRQVPGASAHLTLGKNEQIPAVFFDRCGLYVVKWESGVIDLRIWDKKELCLQNETFSNRFDKNQ